MGGITASAVLLRLHAFSSGEWNNCIFVRDFHIPELHVTSRYYGFVESPLDIVTVPVIMIEISRIPLRRFAPPRKDQNLTIAG